MHTRELMAELGVKTFDELIGKSSLIEVNQRKEKSQGIKLNRLLEEVPYHVNYQKREFNNPINNTLVNGETEIKLVNTDRSFGAIIAKANIESKVIKTTGYAGQSYGAFLPTGYTLVHKGYANDSLGKGLSGGEIIINPPKDHTLLFGNVGLYGATSGYVYIAGSVGERFAIRNSGVKAVVEGVGKHACEYMTGGVVLNLGMLDLNYGAGMSGGVSYVLKENFDKKFLHVDVVGDDVNNEDYEVITELLSKHRNKTNSVLSNKAEHYTKDKFIKIRPV
jgi:glutamate synthase domain-containing protein 3